MRRYGRKMSFNNKSKYDGLRGSYTLANNLLRRYLNFCEGIWASLVDSFLVVAGWTNVNECKLRCPNTIGADHTRETPIWNSMRTFLKHLACLLFKAMIGLSLQRACQLIKTTKAKKKERGSELFDGLNGVG